LGVVKRTQSQRIDGPGQSVRWLQVSFVGLTGLKALTVGSVVPLRVLNLESRGVPVRMISVIIGVYFLLGGLLEVPTGGLADSLGRRRSLLIAGVLSSIGLLVLGLATSVVGLSVGLVVAAFANALGSGPLDAWFVDECADLGAADQVGALGAANSVANVAFAVGAGVVALSHVVFGGLPESGKDLFIETTPVFIFAACLQLVGLALVVLLVQDRDRSGESAEPVAQSTMRTLRRTVSMMSEDASLRNVLLVGALAGALVGAFDVLAPLALRGDGRISASSTVFAVVVIVAFVGAAMTSALSARVEESMGGNAQGISGSVGVMVLGCGACLTLPRSTGIIAAYVVMWIAGGPLHALLHGELHRHVASSERATSVSALTFAVTLGGGSGALAAGLLHDWISPRQLLLVILGLFGLVAVRTASLRTAQLSMVHLDHAEGA
jgi:MFS family permease